MGLLNPEDADGECDEGFSYELRLQQRMAKFVLKARAERSLTQATLNGIMEDITGLLHIMWICGYPLVDIYSIDVTILPNPFSYCATFTAPW